LEWFDDFGGREGGTIEPDTRSVGGREERSEGAYEPLREAGRCDAREPAADGGAGGAAPVPFGAVLVEEEPDERCDAIERARSRSPEPDPLPDPLPAAEPETERAAAEMAGDATALAVRGVRAPSWTDADRARVEPLVRPSAEAREVMMKLGQRGYEHARV
jgi:hypothetical protein